MKREEVVSSYIKSVGYDRENSILEIEFKYGAVHQYQYVDENTYREFINSKSIGSYFNSKIKNAFFFRKL